MKEKMIRWIAAVTPWSHFYFTSIIYQIKASPIIISHAWLVHLSLFAIVPDITLCYESLKKWMLKLAVDRSLTPLALPSLHNQRESPESHRSQTKETPWHSAGCIEPPETTLLLSAWQLVTLAIVLEPALHPAPLPPAARKVSSSDAGAMEDF